MKSSVTDVRKTVSEVVGAVPVYDMHTHLFAPEFGGLILSDTTPANITRGQH